MREIANASLDFRGVPHLLARPSKGEPEGVVVWSEIQPLVDSLSTKLDLAHLKLEQYKNNASIIKRFTLTDGVATVRASPEDGENYTYTTFRISTGFVDNEGQPTIDFEDFAMSAALQPFANEGFRYEFHKEAPDLAVVVFQNIAGAFPDDRVKISLIRIPEAIDEPITPAVGAEMNPIESGLADFKTNFFNWSNFDSRFGAGTWNRLYRGISTGSDGRGVIHFANGNSLSQIQVDAFYDSQNLAAIDAAAGAA